MRSRFSVVNHSIKITESEDVIAARINERFDVLQDLTIAATTGNARAIIVSGPGGLGKSYTVEEVLSNWGDEGKDYRIIKGHVKATGLYKALYEHRHANKVIVFDDADSIFSDDVSLSFLKAVCDSSDVRRISYLGEINLTTEYTEDKLPREFIFEGSIIFISNLDFDAMIERGHRLSPHLEALRSRAYYIDLMMKTRLEYMIRIRQVVAEGLLLNRGLCANGIKDVVDFIEENVNNMRELSLRAALKVAGCRKQGDNWRRTARVTCLRNA